MDSDTSDSNLVIVTNKDRFKRYLKIYKKTILAAIIPIIFLPIAFIRENNAYKSFYIFLVTAAFFGGGFLHPGVTSFLPIVYFTIMAVFNWRLITTINISNSVLDCLGVMALILAMEHSNLHKRVALKMLLIFGCSHFRLSFIIFVTTTMLSMWFSNCMACGLMMPLVKAILRELEKMGILETNEIIDKVSVYATDSEKFIHNPSDFTIFYFIGIVYSSTIGGISTYIGSETNQLLINFCAGIFPDGPKLESPHFMLLTLPGVLIMEMFLYLWLNFYYLGMLRVQNYTALQASLTSDEEQLISVLLTGQYQQRGKLKFQEMVVGATVIFAAILQAIILSSTSFNEDDKLNTKRYLNATVPCIVCVFILFVTPTSFDCIKFFKKRNDNSEPLPTAPTRSCLTWTMVKNNIDWSVIFLNASANLTFESLEDSKMTGEFEKFLSLFSDWPAPAQAFVVILFCKVLTEFADNATVGRCMLTHVANVIGNKLVTIDPLPAHYRARVTSQYEKGSAIVHYAGHVRIGRLHTPLRTLWRTLRRAGFLTMFSFTVEGVKSRVNPLYLMLGATLSTSLPFHLVTGTPAYAMLSSYVHIPPRKLIIAGIGPSVMAILMNVGTVCVWSKVIWPDIDTFPTWADGMRN